MANEEMSVSLKVEASRNEFRENLVSLSHGPIINRTCAKLVGGFVLGRG